MDKNVIDCLAQPTVLPCPFCGRPPKMSVHGGITFIYCSTAECPASHSSKIETDEVAALKRWNTRHTKEQS